MFKCLNCERTFDSPAKQYDEFGIYISVCPYCEHDELDEMSKCKMCGEPARYFERLCDNCKEIIRKEFREPIRFLKECGFEMSDISDEFTYLVEGE